MGGKSPVSSWGWRNGIHYFLVFLKTNIKYFEPFESIKTNDEIIYLYNWEYKKYNFDIDFKLEDEKFNIEFASTDEDKPLDNLPNELVENLCENLNKLAL